MTELGTVEQQSMVGDLGRNVGAPVATYPTTCTASNQWVTTCGSGSSRDISYVWTAPSDGSYSISTMNSSFDTVLEARELRNSSQVLDCNDDASGTLQSRIILRNLTRGRRLLIIIEGYQGDCGSTHLNIRRL